MELDKLPYMACMRLAVEDFRTTTDYERRKRLGALIRLLSELCTTELPEPVRVWFESREAKRTNKGLSSSGRR